MRLIGMLALMALLLVGCDLTETTSAIPPVQISPTPIPSIPLGVYAFVRNGNLWARTGLGPAHLLVLFNADVTTAVWSPLIWSPDHAQIAFGLLSPPIAPGMPGTALAPATGTLFVVQAQTGAVLPLTTLGTLQAPLQGHHLAWRDSTTLLFTQDGAVRQLSLGAIPAAATLSGPRSVWEIQVRGTTLYYSTVTHVTPAATGTAEVRAFDLQTQVDRLVVTLGLVQLPFTNCGGVVCPPDLSRPIVPYAWAVSSDGTRIAYQQASAVNGAPAATPTPGSSYRLAHTDGTAVQPIFSLVPSPAFPVALAFAPDGTALALAAAASTDQTFGPFFQYIGTPGVSDCQPLADQAVLDGPLSWLPDSRGFSLTERLPGTFAGDIVSCFLDDERVVTEYDADLMAWG